MTGKNQGMIPAATSTPPRTLYWTEVAAKMSMNPAISRPTDRPMEVSRLVHLRMFEPTFGKGHVQDAESL
jgi:hypothetical protein